MDEQDMDDVLDGLLRRLRRHSVKSRQKEIAKVEKAQTEQKTETSVTPQAEPNLESVVKSLNKFLVTHESLFDLVSALHKLLPPKKKDESISWETFEAMWLHRGTPVAPFANNQALFPPSIALITLHEFFSNSDRWEIVDPKKVPDFDKLRPMAYEEPRVTHTTVTIGTKSFTIPISNQFWVQDKTNGARYVVEYEPGRGPINLTMKSHRGEEERDRCVDLILEITNLVKSSPYLKGQIIEVSGGTDIKIVDIGENHPMPIVSPELLENLEKNITSLFDKAPEFKKHNLPLRRAVILEGDPGCGKTMIARYLASKLKGRVTTVWVTAKAIDDADDVAEVFEIARRLSPALVVMEDLDMISGTRDTNYGGSSPLGEMLNQLDGLTVDDSLVLLASTNRVSSLDQALRDRPGRFDRVFTVEKPNADLAKRIAQNYLRAHGVPESRIEGLGLSSIMTGEFTGAQVIEIVKGGLFEAIHQGRPVDDTCIVKSKKGLEEQRKLFGGRK